MWSGSTLFTLTTGISIKHSNNKKLIRHPAFGNRLIQRFLGEESTWCKLLMINYFLFKVTIPALANTSPPFQPTKLCRTVDEAKTLAAEFCLQQLGIPLEGEDFTNISYFSIYNRFFFFFFLPYHMIMGGYCLLLFFFHPSIFCPSGFHFHSIASFLFPGLHLNFIFTLVFASHSLDLLMGKFCFLWTCSPR